MSERYDSHSAVSSGLHRDHSFHRDKSGTIPLNSTQNSHGIYPHVHSLYHSILHINSIKIGQELICAPYAGNGRHEFWTGVPPFLDRRATDKERRPHFERLVKRLLKIPSPIRSRIAIERDELGDYELYVDGKQYTNGNGHRSR